jgi:hypothetical protein
VLALALLAQVLVWSIVHFTDVRESRLGPGTGTSAPVVVASTVEDAASVGDGATDANTVLSAGGVRLQRTAALVQTVGVVSCLILVALMLQGVVIAGGSSVPGVEMAVTACTWTLVVVALALPLGGVLPEVAYPGVFVSYETLVMSSMGVRGGGSGMLVFYGHHMVLPLLMIAGLGAAVIRFRVGVEHGVIVTNMSQLDEKVEHEIRSMKLGQLSTPRSVGALHSAIGENDAVPTASPISAQGAGSAGGRPI